MDISPETVQRIRSDLRDIRIWAVRNFPFIVIPLSYMRVIATEAVPTASVDESCTLAINPDFWFNLSVEGKRFIAIHELLHIILLHPVRGKGFKPIAFNVAADGKINSSLDGGREIEMPKGAVTLGKIEKLTGIKLEDLEKMSTEEIARILEKHIKTVKVGLPAGKGGDGEGEDGEYVEVPGERYGEEARSYGEKDRDLIGGKIEEGVEVQPAKGELAKAQTQGSRKELEEAVKRMAEKAKSFAKIAGKLPAGLERIVDEILEVKPPWNLVIRFGIRSCEKLDSTWASISRRGPEYPGPIGYQYTAWILVDCSGSITENELSYFLGLVKSEAKKGEVKVVPWDGQPYGILVARRPQDVARQVAPKMRGGGGTVIKPCLIYVYSRMRQGDGVIILTDGYIWDMEKGKKEREETEYWFRKIAGKAGCAILAYTQKPVGAPKFNEVHLDLKAKSST